jgi:hypothetical protein
MGIITLVLATLLYVLTAVDFALKRDWAMCLVFGAYALANLGLILVAYRNV